MDSLNRMAIELADEALDFAEELGVGAFELDDGATVIDFGIDFPGGIEAGLLLAELQTAGLATVQTRMDTVAGAPMPHVELATDRPDLALLGSQKAGWELAVDEFEGLGSGPARALVAEEPEFRAIEYTDAFDLTVLAVETDRLPTAAVADEVASRAGVNPEGVYLAAFPSASLAGSVSIAARAAELAVFRLFELGYNPTNVLTASGSAPVAPIPATEEAAMARTNDAIAYGGQAHLTVREDADVFEDLPSTATDEYGTPFLEIFEEVDWDMHEVDPGVFAPAQATVDVVGGPTYALGERNEERLAESFGL
ncbi:methenyltetrahydromethanopterin cyclohydrolase [Halanaeroarchaeum sulfurireducens]|uniref:Methenyltetrahydromethanopterin cyclohydrolase n=1 Tax=Halanaeroarchaeum sulfurireducens TaxID=1604004 RepID=A0A0F7PAS2_9EURY|nr:methenyltetrahydromethanopterin cyclohydrolase [Halanaeroarchaeum sulfurireducens]AKH98276.1 methenyltetrahydromethanopterin cyclohydrolase [Halanaeroarchaeum sulfurireducens]ALG82670.1 methenyltetrahydromethanopterin cyclohydrolase [Halanaeroarchaeum sulfurireducens]